MSDPSGLFIFPKWTRSLRVVLAVGLTAVPAYVVLLVAYGASPKTTDVGYAPEQPIPYSHALHVGELGLDCRYCHCTVEDAGHAAIPSTEICMNCHNGIRIEESPKLERLWESHATGKPIEWVRVHDLPDYVYFNHSAHVRRGVSCVSCHGEIHKMEVVKQVEPLSMGWCLDCHRDPDPHLRNPAAVFNMAWKPAGDPADLGLKVREELGIDPSTDCSTCHR